LQKVFVVALVVAATIITNLWLFIICIITRFLKGQRREHFLAAGRATFTTKKLIYKAFSVSFFQNITRD
jgi:hypothetical protein